MAIYSDSDYGYVIQIKNDFCADSDTSNTINTYLFGIISFYIIPSDGSDNDLAF